MVVVVVEVDLWWWFSVYGSCVLMNVHSVLEFLVRKWAVSGRFKRGVTGCNQNIEYETQVLLGVRDSAPGSQEADKLYRIPAVTGSNLLSPGFQALVPCCRGELRTLRSFAHFTPQPRHYGTLLATNGNYKSRKINRCVRIGNVATPDLDAYASSPDAYAYRTIIYRCETLDVSFPMALKPSHLDLYSPSLLQSDDNSSLSHRFILAPFAFLGRF
ncbi:hypothetical protein PIB30_014243 [Stylosanthes scabra]|uniref:Uncharacterized protein n=1 Tax=Stylosanthes scabra TaxID=79078 RepID=A0ABU6X6I9_9FABA|nr:hypothetical protein [Stylosanthes scabra]